MRPWRDALDTRLAVLLMALAATAATFFEPTIPREQEVYAYLFVVDITRSMNAEDYRLDGRPVSRLQYVKHALHETISRLPCGSRAGLALFTERSSAVLFMPVEVCENFGVIDEAIAHIDWRMAWAADSNIAQGLFNTLRLMHALRDERGVVANIVFMSDGHEAPPVNPRYTPDFNELSRQPGEIVPGAITLARQRAAHQTPELEGKAGEIRGFIVGVGDKGLTPIPKYREDGKQEGFYTAEDVPHAARFGDPSPEEIARIEGYEPRNAPWGKTEPTGNEHLTQVREDYLMSLAEKTGLVYRHLTTAEALGTALQSATYATVQREPTDIRYIAGGIAAMLLVGLYAVPLVWRQYLIARPGRHGHPPAMGSVPTPVGYIPGAHVELSHTNC